MKLQPPLKEEVMPKNILMIGPTGVGKTEVARRLAKLAGAPFIKVISNLSLSLSLSFSCFSVFLEIPSPPSSCPFPSPSFPPPTPLLFPSHSKVSWRTQSFTYLLQTQVEATKYTEVGFHGKVRSQKRKPAVWQKIHICHQGSTG